MSAQDAVYLGHLDPVALVHPRHLARHLGIAASTLSAFIERMRRLGYVERVVSSASRREVELRLTPRGAAAVQAASILDLERLRLVLARLAPADRRRAVEGLVLLARASRAARADYEKRRGAPRLPGSGGKGPDA